MFWDQSTRTIIKTSFLCLGCDRSKYIMRKNAMRFEKDNKIKDLAKNLNEAKNRKEALQLDDPQQAQSFFKST